MQFVLGVKHAQPADRDILEFEVGKLKQLMPEATWVAAGIGRHQLDVNRWCLEMGGHCRTGLEDNVRWDKSRLAASNAELVSRVADLCAEYNRVVATPAVARGSSDSATDRRAAQFLNDTERIHFYLPRSSVLSLHRCTRAGDLAGTVVAISARGGFL